MSCTMDEIVAAAKARGYKASYKIDSKNNSQYAILNKNGDKLSLRYEDKERAGGVRTHVGSLMKDFPGTTDQVLDWFEGQLSSGNYGCKIDAYIASMPSEE